MRKFLWEAAGVGITLALALQGCGGRVDQVNVGSEQGPRDLAGSGKQLAGPTGTAGPQVGQVATPMPACPMTRTDASGFNEGVGTYSSDGSLLVTITDLHSPPLEVFRVADNTVMSAFEIPPSDTYHKAAISPDNSMVAASGGRDLETTDAMVVYRVADGSLLADLQVSEALSSSWAPAPAPRFVSPDFSHDGRLLVTAGGIDGGVDIWSVPDFHRVRRLSLDWATSVRFSPDDTRLVAVGSWPPPPGPPRSAETITVWNVADGALLWSQPLNTYGGTYPGPSPAAGAPGGTGDAMFSPNGTEVVSAGMLGNTATSVWNATTGALIQELSQSDPPAGSGSLSFYDDDHILIGDDLRGARIWTRGATGLFAPSCFLASEGSANGRNTETTLPPGGPYPGGAGPAVVAASRGGQHVYLVGRGVWIYEQAQ
ncbi:MAG: WD40 repeat domain-containing protein [Polyangiaceae bacterium]